MKKMKTFKRILSVALAMNLALSIFPCGYAQENEESDYTVLLQENFDNTLSPNEHGEFAIIAGSLDSAPDRVGKAAKLNLTASNVKNMRFALNEPISSGTVYIGYDYFGEGKGDANDVFMATPDNQAVLGDATGLFYNSGILQLYTSLVAGATKIGATKSQAKKWHRVESWLDLDLRKAYFYLDGDLIASTDIGDNLKTFAGWGRVSRYFIAENVEIIYP